MIVKSALFAFAAAWISFVAGPALGEGGGYSPDEDDPPSVTAESGQSGPKINLPLGEDPPSTARYRSDRNIPPLGTPEFFGEIPEQQYLESQIRRKRKERDDLLRDREWIENHRDWYDRPGYSDQPYDEKMADLETELRINDIGLNRYMDRLHALKFWRGKEAAIEEAERRWEQQFEWDSDWNPPQEAAENPPQESAQPVPPKQSQPDLPQPKR